MKNLFWAAVLIAIVPELVFLAADPVGVGTDVSKAAGLVGVSVSVVMLESRRDAALKLGRRGSTTMSSSKSAPRIPHSRSTCVPTARCPALGPPIGA
jgi:hypothetical protein